MAKRDYYEILGVPKTADEAALKSAFRKAAIKYHPDKNPGDAEAEAKFKEINEAYQVLSDGQKRAAYDRFGHQAFEGGGGGGPGGFGQGFNGGFGPDFSSSMGDIFEDIFGDVFGNARRAGGGGGGAPKGRERGSDLRYNLDITLQDAFKGKSATLKVPSSVTCDTCSGSGAKSGAKPKNCSTCGGSGRIRATQGFFSIERTCHICGGRGQVIDDPCKTCRGDGRVARERTLSVTIPPGVEDGTRVRVAGEGEAGTRGAPSGDLYVFLSVKAHGFFSRDGSDLFCRVPISLVAAALGTEIKVPTLSGAEIGVKIPEGTQTGKQFRLKGYGMPLLRTREMGDLYVQVVVETPQNLTSRQKELLNEFEEGSSKETSPESAGFFTKIRDFFGN